MKRTATKKPSKKTATKPRTTKPKAPAKKPAAKAPKKTRAAKPAPAVEEPRVDAPDPPPAPPTPAEERAALEVPGEAIFGDRLSAAIRYVVKATEKKGGLVVFTHDDEGVPLVSGHDPRRSHTAFLPANSAFRCDIAVPRAEAVCFADLLDGLVCPRVRIAEDGEAIVHHGAAQPQLRFALGSRPITQHWQPPSQQDRKTAVGPLRIQASQQASACRWSNAIVHTHQSADGIEWNTLTDADTGELLASAVLAEDGRDLYPEDQRQTEIPGSRTVGQAAETLRRGMQTLADQTGTTVSVSDGEGRTVAVAEPTPPPPPTPDSTLPAHTTRAWILAASWNLLSQDDQEALDEPREGLLLEWGVCLRDDVLWRTVELPVVAVDHLRHRAAMSSRPVEVFVGEEPPAVTREAESQVAG